MDQARIRIDLSVLTVCEVGNHLGRKRPPRAALQIVKSRRAVQEVPRRIVNRAAAT